MHIAWAEQWLLEAFNKADLAALERLYHPRVQFADVPLGVAADGWPGLRDFFCAFLIPAAGQHRFLPDTYLGRARDGVVEWTWRGTLGDSDLFQLGVPCKGKRFEVKGNSVFRFDPDGLVIEERDYWDLATVLRQIQI